jgi:vacuolar-type H+-ATPase subunit C/Vma6
MLEQSLMARSVTEDLDYLGARLHGRRSQIAEGGRLDALCRVRGVSELVREVYPETPSESGGDFQRRLAQDLVSELAAWLGHLEGAGARLLAWHLVRFQLEDLKVLLRGLLNHTPLAALEGHLLSLPRGLRLDAQALLAAGHPRNFADQLPAGMPRSRLREAIAIHPEPHRSFFLEAALDCGYFQELLARTKGLPGEDADLIEPLVRQEVEMFNLMLGVRGKFQYRLSPDLLGKLRVGGGGGAGERFSALLAAPDPMAAAAHFLGCALDALPPGQHPSGTVATFDGTTLEALAWSRFLRLANRAFRTSHMGLAAVIGYAGIRRVEVANLITLSECLRSSLSAEAIRARMLPHRQTRPP